VSAAHSQETHTHSWLVSMDRHTSRITTVTWNNGCPGPSRIWASINLGLESLITT
jgi:hypothetical protein